MAVNLTNADKALKTLYLDVVSNQLNEKVNPFFAQIKQSTNDVCGKEIKKLAIYGVNGGIGAGTEEGELPSANGNNYEEFTLPLKNLYGTIEISDKAVRASENSSGAFVNLLTAEMEGLINASTFNFGRMLFGDGSGVLAKVSSFVDEIISVDSVRNLVEGMVVDFRDGTSKELIDGLTGRRITYIDRVAKMIKISGTNTPDLMRDGAILTIQGSFGNEITGLGKIFDPERCILYGVDRGNKEYLNPYIKENAGKITESMIQTTLDTIEEASGSSVNFIVCSWGVRRALINLFATTNRVVNTLELEGGFKALSYNGIPIVADRFCPEGYMYFLNTNDFTLHQLCDWQWLADDDGRVLKQIPGKPVYTATLVKYADLLCSRPNGQGLIRGITEA